MNPPDTKGRIGSAEIAGQLRRDIACGRLAARDKLPAERTLACTYGVARGTIRDALMQLANEGLVRVRAGSGTYVSDAPDNSLATVGKVVLSNTPPLELLDARLALEPQVCRLATEHATNQDLDQIMRQIATMKSNPTKPAAICAADQALHCALAESTGNTMLVWMASQISQARDGEPWRRAQQVTMDSSTIAQYCADHQQLLAAIKAHEAEQAATLMTDHLNSVRVSIARVTENRFVQLRD